MRKQYFLTNISTFACTCVSQTSNWEFSK